MLCLLSNDCLNGSPGLFWPTANPVSTKESAGQIFGIFTGTHIYTCEKHFALGDGDIQILLIVSY